MSSHTRNSSIAGGSLRYTDIRERSNIVILGRDVVKALFEFEDPIDKEIKIGGLPFHVVGVMESLGRFSDNRATILFSIPITSYQKYYPE
jgi:putative ABC transport system permease protein